MSRLTMASDRRRRCRLAGADRTPRRESPICGGRRCLRPGSGSTWWRPGAPRPIQLDFDARGRLVVLSPGWFGDAAGEIYRLDVSGPLPVDGTRVPRVVIPFPEDNRKVVFGGLIVDPRTGDLFLGEENGNRIYRLGADHRLQALAVGLNHLLGGSAMTLDRQGRLVFLDYASPETHLRSETPLPPSLSWLARRGLSGAAGLPHGSRRGAPVAEAGRRARADPPPPQHAPRGSASPCGG